MRARASTHRTDAVLRHDLFQAADRVRVDTADFLELIAEFDARRLYLSEGYSSMHAFCVGQFRMCEDSAYKRIQAARAGWRYPQLFEALAEGRLHLTAVFLLTPHLTPANVDELIAAATHRTTREIRGLLGQWFLGSAAELRFETASTPVEAEELTPVAESSQLESIPIASTPSKTSQRHVPQHVGPPLRVDVRCTVDAAKLDYARALLSHSIPSGDLGKVLDRVLELATPQLERAKFGATARPRVRAQRRPSSNPRAVPARVKREVWTRDGGRCTFVGRDGHRCGERRFLEFDHVQPVALGGGCTSAEDIRLRCRSHNQFEAERVFGVDFMEGKRARARQARADARAAERSNERNERTRLIVSGLRGLGCGAEEARRAAEGVGDLRDASIEECLCAALRSLRAPRSTRREEIVPAPATVMAETRMEALAVSGP